MFTRVAWPVSSCTLGDILDFNSQVACRCPQLDEDCIKAYVLQGKAYAAMKEFEKSLESFRQVSRIDPSKETLIQGDRKHLISVIYYVHLCYTLNV